jgi:hypothetical protein
MIRLSLDDNPFLCPSCKRAFDGEDVNISTDLAQCRVCKRIFRLSELADEGANSVDLVNPHPGVWYLPRVDGFTIGATTQSWMTALFLVPFTCVWAGASVGGMYVLPLLRGQPLTEGFFGIPFLLGSAFLVAQCIMAIAGKVEVSREGDRCSVFTGIGPIGWTRRVNWSHIHTVREDVSASGRSTKKVIVLEGGTRVAFGSELNEERRYFLLTGLKRLKRESQ